MVDLIAEAKPNYLFVLYINSYDETVLKWFKREGPLRSDAMHSLPISD